MSTKLIDPVFDAVQKDLTGIFGGFAEKLARNCAAEPFSSVNFNQDVPYEPLERSYLVRLAIKLACHAGPRATTQSPTEKTTQSPAVEKGHRETFEALGDKLFDLPDAFIQARENVLRQSFYANGVIANLNDLCARQREQIASLEKKLKAQRKQGASGETKIIESFKKLVIGMAWSGFRFNPYLCRNDATKEISGDLEKLGLKLDDETILARLREAADVLPEEGKQVIMEGRRIRHKKRPS
jgi:hypothetical protein